jgi:GT2 family glycosyltransferase/glycosyltransferase involved in cell wall biosynthesis
MPEPPPQDPDAIRQEQKALARAAWQRGQEALATGAFEQAARWLDRAWRLAPSDRAVALSRAVLRLRQGDAMAAAAMLEALVAKADIREAWLALAAARIECGDAAGAAAALQTVLSGHALPQDTDISALAARIARAADAAGWCGVRGDGTIRAEGLHARARIMPAANGQRVVRAGGRDVLGSPIDLTRLARLEGVVAAVEDGIAGWAWHPNDPDRDPLLVVCGSDGKGRFTIRADDTGMDAQIAMTRPRRFRIDAARLARLRPPFSVSDRFGVPLSGSPIDPDAPKRAAVAVVRTVARRYPARGRSVLSPLAGAAIPVGPPGPSPNAPSLPQRPVAVVIPVHGGLAMTRDCLARVRATLPSGSVVIVVDDASPDPALATELDALARAGAIRLLRLAGNRGFPAAANAGMRRAIALPGQPDIILLNSDTLPAPGWVEALRHAVHATGDAGTASPLSNDAAILSYPKPNCANPVPAGRALARRAGEVARAGGPAVEIPTTVGFCMYIRRECLVAVGVFRDDVFAQGYGEENDFCLRAHHLGWRHLAVTSAYVAHLSGQSFGAATGPLLARNLAVLEALHPGYGAMIDSFIARDPLAPARRAIDALRWRAGRLPDGAEIIVTHTMGGGVERVVQAEAARIAAAGRRAVLLRPALTDTIPERMIAGTVSVHDGVAPDAHPNLRFAMPEALPALTRLLKGDRVHAIQIHHMLGHAPEILDLARRLHAPLSWHVHDYASFCPRISLLGRGGRYCGEPTDPAECDACVADLGSTMPAEGGVAALRARQAASFAQAAAVIAPSQDAASRIARHFPGISPRVVRLEDDSLLPQFSAMTRSSPRRVAVIGAIGMEKGYDVLLACARDAAARALDLEFVVVGHTTDDARLMQTGRVFVTGRYDESESAALIAEQQADIAFLPSIWPETWCFALSVAWRAGLAAVVFDIGAQAERVRSTNKGWILPLGLPPNAVNNALLSVRLPPGAV